LTNSLFLKSNICFNSNDCIVSNKLFTASNFFLIAAAISLHFQRKIFKWNFYKVFALTVYNLLNCLKKCFTIVYFVGYFAQYQLQLFGSYIELFEFGSFNKVLLRKKTNQLLATIVPYILIQQIVHIYRLMLQNFLIWVSFRSNLHSYCTISVFPEWIHKQALDKRFRFWKIYFLCLIWWLFANGHLSVQS